MVRTIQEPLPTPTRHVASGSSSGPSKHPFTGSRIPVPTRPPTSIPRFNVSAKSKALTTSSSRGPVSVNRKRTVLGEREDNTPIGLVPLPTKRKSRTSLTINPISTPLTSSQNSPTRPMTVPSPVRAPSSSSSSSTPLQRIPRPSFTRLDAMDEDVTQLLDMRVPESLSGMTTDSEDGWFSGVEEVGNVTVGRTPMPPRKSGGGWGRAIQGEARLMTPMNSQEIQSSQPVMSAPTPKVNPISRLPTPPSSQPAEPASTPQRPSPPSRRRARPSPTPPRRISTGPAQTSVEPSPNPRTKKNPRLTSLGSMADLRQPGTPRDRLEVVIPLHTSSAGKGKGKGRASTGSQRSSLSASQSSSSSSRRISASQPTPKEDRNTLSEVPSSAPQSRRRSTSPLKQASSEKSRSKPRKSRAGRHSTPSALALYAGVNARRKSLAPPLTDREGSRDPIDLDNDPLLLKPNEMDNDDLSIARGSQTEPRSKGKGKAKGPRSSLVAPGTTRKIVMSFPFKPYSTAPLPPSNVPEWVPRTVRKKKVELEYNLDEPSSSYAQLGQEDGDEEGYGHQDGFGSDSDDGGFGGIGGGADDTFMGVLARREGQLGKQRAERARSEETVVEGDQGVLNGPSSQEKSQGIGGLDETPLTLERSSPTLSPVVNSSPRSRSSTPADPPHSDQQSTRVDEEEARSNDNSSLLYRNEPEDSPASASNLSPEILPTYSGDDNLNAECTLAAEQPEILSGQEMATSQAVIESLEEADTTVDAVSEVWDDSVITEEGDMDEESFLNEQDSVDGEVQIEVEDIANESGRAASADLDDSHVCGEEIESEIVISAGREEDVIADRLGAVYEKVNDDVREEVNEVSVQSSDFDASAASPSLAVTETIAGQDVPSVAELDRPTFDTIQHHELPAPNTQSTAINTVDRAAKSAEPPSFDFTAENEPSGQTFDEAARSSLSSSQISESEGDLTLEAIESGWESEESNGEIGLGLVAAEDEAEEREELFPEIASHVEAEAERLEGNSTEAGHPITQASAREDSSTDAVRQQPDDVIPPPASSMLAASVTPSQLALSTIALTAQASPPGPSSPEDSRHASDTTPAGASAANSDTNPKSSEATRSAPAAPPTEGKIVVKLITRVVKLEHDEEDQDADEEEEVEVESEEEAEQDEEEEEGEERPDDEEDDTAGQIEAEGADTSSTGEDGELIPHCPIGPAADVNKVQTSSLGSTTASVTQPTAISANKRASHEDVCVQPETARVAPSTPPRRHVPTSTTPTVTPPSNLREAASSQSQADRAAVAERPVSITQVSSISGASSLGIAEVVPAVGLPPAQRPASAKIFSVPLPASARTTSLARPSRLSQQVTADTSESSPARPEPTEIDFALTSVSAQQCTPLGNSPVIEEGISIRSAGRSLLAEIARAEGKDKARELKGVVEVSSLDPRAAARAAAILKLNHNYIEHGIPPSSSTTSDIPKTPKTPSSPKKLSRRKSYTSEHFDSIASARKLTAEELLNEAELEIVVNEGTPHRRRREGTAFSAVSGVSGTTDLPIPGGWVRTPKRKRAREVTPSLDTDQREEHGRAEVKAWGISEWKRLEKVYRAEKEAWVKEREVKALPGGLMSWARRSTGMGTPAPEVKEWDEQRVVKRFLQTEGGDKASMCWNENDLLLRVQALERRVNTKISLSRAEPAGSPTKKARKEASLVTPLKSRSQHSRTPAGLAPPSTIKRVLSWVWGSSFTPVQDDGTGKIEAVPSRSKGKERDVGERPNSLPIKDSGMILPVAVVPIELGLPEMRQVSARPVLPTAPPRSTLSRLSGRHIFETCKASSIKPTEQAEEPAIAEPTVPNATRSLAVSTTSDKSHLGLSTSSTATSGTFPPQTPRLYPPLNQSITQRSAAIKALFPSIHPLGDSTSSTSSSTSGNTSVNRSNPLAALNTKTSVKDLAKSFEEKGTLDLALRRVPSGASELEALKKVRSREQR